MPTIKTTPTTTVTIAIEIPTMIVAVTVIGTVVVIVIAPATIKMIATINPPETNPLNLVPDLVIAPEMMTLSPMKMNNHFKT